MNATPSKFLSLSPSLPWLYNDQLDNFAAGDVDGDGRQEVLVTNCPGTLAGGLAADTIGVAPAMGLLSYFLYRDLEPQNWANEQAAHMLTMWTAQGIVMGSDSSRN